MPEQHTHHPQLHHFSLPYGRFSFTMAAEKTASLPPYKGSTLRGILGQPFKELACLDRRQRDCKDCTCKPQCAYAYVFETSRHSLGPNGESMHLFTPHPFVIQPPLEPKTEYGPGEKLSFCLVLLGRGMQFLPHFIASFDLAARKGLGVNRVPFRLLHVEQLLPDSARPIWKEGMKLTGIPVEERLEISPTQHREPGEIILKLVTPLRLVLQGEPARDLTFESLVKSIFRRLELLDHAHGSGSFKLDYPHFLSKADQVEMADSQLYWHHWKRYSNRQKKKLYLGGLVGQVSFRGDMLGAFWPYLSLAEKIHLGKGTVYGLGQIQVETG